MTEVPTWGKDRGMSNNFQPPSHLIDQLIDTDPQETAEWQESLDAVLKSAGPVRARYLMLNLLNHAQSKNLEVSELRATDYINTIPPAAEPEFPGDEEIEHKIRRYMRWNAAIMVHRAQRPGIGVGGHISSYASSASLYEVGFNHFFRGQDHAGGGDQIYFQGHASPGMYARAFLEGRLSEKQMDGFRQELSHEGGGLSSYPHPRLMPEFWQFPTVSMRGLTGIYMAAGLRTPAIKMCGRSWAMGKLMNQRRLEPSAWQLGKAWII
jgi:pyruvate dehydrogenase E1 component